MIILIAADSFKDALSAIEVCKAIERGLKLAVPTVKTVLFPLADGGEGTAEILLSHKSGEEIKLRVKDPLMRAVDAVYGLSGDGQTAFIEMARASGLQLLKPAERNPLHTTTYGTGEMILDAVKKGVGNILLAIGGSATNDAGTGMAQALGYRFLDEQGQELQPIGQNLWRMEQIDAGGVSVDLNKIRVDVICDVDNPLYGPKGAAYTYARQKGAGEPAIEQLDLGLRHFAGILQGHFGKDFSQLPGAGAAGGLGAGCMAFLGAHLRPGIEAIMDYTGFEEKLRLANLIITGEGKLDRQTQHGKLIQGITRKAQKHNIPVIALCGTLSASPGQIKDLELTAAFSILPAPITLEEALKQTAALLEQTAFNLMRTLNTF